MTTEPEQPSPSMVERKLVTILSADVAEYSRLMAEDEEHTLRIFREYSHTFAGLVEMHHGRIFNTAGDAILAEFTSPVEAVRCATDIQAALHTRNDQLPPNRRVKFRIGVNLGDVMTHDSDLLGDGVNVAARLQSAAEPGGICISGSVYDQIRNKLTLNIESLGERRYKNIPQPVRTFTIGGSEDHGALPVAKAPSIRLETLIKPAIAVVALLVLAGAYWAYATHRSSPVEPLSAGLNSAAVVTGSLKTQSGALLADAQRRHRPQTEIDALTDSNTRIAALDAQLHKLGTKPGEAAKAAPLNSQMKTIAGEMSRGEAAALGNAGDLLWQDMQKPPGETIAPDAAKAIAAVQQAKAKLDDAVAAAQNARDEAVSLNATMQALAGYDALAAAYDGAAPVYVTARRSELATLATAAQGISDRLASLGGVNKPWLFASHARKDAYDVLANNAGEARSQVAELDALESRAGNTNDLRKISAAVNQGLTIKSRLNRMLARSNAAYSTYSQ